MSSPKPATQTQPLDEHIEMASAGNTELEASHASGHDQNQDMGAYENRSIDLRTVGAIVVRPSSLFITSLQQKINQGD